MSYNPAVQSRQVLRASSVSIGTGYDASPTELRVNNQNTIMLYCDLTLNTATSAEIQVDFATPAEGTNLGARDDTPASGDWFTRAIEGSPSSGVVAMSNKTFQLTATGRYEIPVTPVMGKWFRVRAKTTGGPGSTTLSIVGVEGLA